MPIKSPDHRISELRTTLENSDLGANANREGRIDRDLPAGHDLLKVGKLAAQYVQALLARLAEIAFKVEIAVYAVTIAVVI